MMKEIKSGVLGKVIGFCYTIEFQKRGLPHAHILVWLEDKPEHTQQIDHLVCSEIPNPEQQPGLYSKVKQHMMHGPCGVFNNQCPCMDPTTSSCSKHYPKKIVNETFINDLGETVHRRRNTTANGNVVT